MEDAMIKSFPLTFDGIILQQNEIVDLCLLENKIAIVHFAFGHTTQEEFDKEKRTPSYVLLETYSLDFDEHQQAFLSYYEQETFSASDAICYWDQNRLLLNTQRYKGFNPSIAKIIQIRDTMLIEIEDAPQPIQAIYNDHKCFIFGEIEVHMASRFIMECRMCATKKILWKLKLSAYLYTPVEENKGILYFGTAGKGGRFYGVNAATGVVIFNYNTGGTVNFAHYNEQFIIADRKGKPILIDALDGTERQKIEFGKFKITYDQYMLVNQDKLYAIVRGKDGMYAICADLID